MLFNTLPPLYTHRTLNNGFWLRSAVSIICIRLPAQASLRHGNLRGELRSPLKNPHCAKVTLEFSNTENSSVMGILRHWFTHLSVQWLYLKHVLACHFSFSHKGRRKKWEHCCEFMRLLKVVPLNSRMTPLPLGARAACPQICRGRTLLVVARSDGTEDYG